MSRWAAISRFADEPVVRKEAAGFVAGVVGTAILTAFEWVERRANRSLTPLYAAGPVGRSLGARWRRPGRDLICDRAGLVLRWLYGPTLGFLFGAARRSFVRRHGGILYGIALEVRPTPD